MHTSILYNSIAFVIFHTKTVGLRLSLGAAYVWDLDKKKQESLFFERNMKRLDFS
jgi:hypothetical protein